ncbi:MAG TPA: NADH-quinone oxidoreductase subunit A [Thermoplasmata archaeon]|nr:NADH-quinone oxidoreductase subunit A [Thermoplasmata archaeon]
MDVLLAPFIVFAAALAVAGILYLWGRSLAPPASPGGHKQEMYTGGEAPRETDARPSYEFYHAALFFTVLHVAALFLVTAAGGPAAALALLYLGVLAVALAALVGR